MLGLIQPARIIDIGFIESKSPFLRNRVKNKKKSHPYNGVGKLKEKA